MQTRNFSNIRSIIFLNYYFIFLWRMRSPFTQYANYYPTVDDKGVDIFVSVTNGRIDERIYKFLESPLYTDSNGI